MIPLGESKNARNIPYRACKSGRPGSSSWADLLLGVRQAMRATLEDGKREVATDI